ncbi:glycosyltransferase [Leifsonia poae]|uniref:glycosyltransferase n=1 Tax=Leifsonia poae TaxID=110933 RepID=UPI001CBAB29D|nr:glycosyltransferase [Leifsonia poae]
MVKRRAGVVSVVLVNFRGADDTIECIRELNELNWPRELLEIVVVENGSGDDSREKLKALGDQITLVVSEENRGFTGGCNLGVSKSTGEFVAFLNNDAKPHADWIATAVDTFASGTNIGAVASKVLDWEGERVDYLDAAITWYGMGYKPHAGEMDRGSWDTEKDVLFGTGAAMFVRAAVFEELGGFDDTYFMFYEDVDLGWRMNLLGYRFRFQPASLAYHKHHASMNKFGSYRETYLLERNALYTLYKNLDDESLAQVFPGALLLATRRAVARGDLDSTSFDLRKSDDDSQPEKAVSKQTLAGIFAIDQFVELLPETTAARARVQSTRVRSDRELTGLFGNTDEPAYPIESYLRGYEKIVDTLGQLHTGGRRRVLVITGDPVGERMAGPAIRAWNIARLLADEHDVRLVSMSSAIPLDDRVEVGVISHHRPSSVSAHEEWADIIIVQGHALELFPSLEKSRKILVVDVYDPLHLEQLEQGKGQSLKAWNKQVNEATDALNHQLQLGDFFLCASEQQRHFWLGQLAALGRINAYTYSRDNDLDSLIAVAPFGVPSEDPVHVKPVMRGVVPGISEGDKVVVWGGGIYDWFDPEILIRAIAKLAQKHPEIRLFFMGVKHPNPAVPEMEAVARARLLAGSLGVNGKNVFFNESWVPYEDRQNYLLEADLGVSTHFQHVETTFSFRTRILDYLWAGLPIVTTGGDSFGRLVAAESLGASVPERDLDALADAIEKLLFNDKAIAAARKNVARVRQEFTWVKTLAPLLEFCRNPIPAADKAVASGKKNAAGGKGRPGGATYQAPKRVTGVRRDLQRVAYYLKEGGPGAVVERVRARQDRKRDAAG